MFVECLIGKQKSRGSGCGVCVFYYCRTYYKAVRVGGGGECIMMCYERRRAEACVDVLVLVLHGHGCAVTVSSTGAENQFQGDDNSIQYSVMFIRGNGVTLRTQKVIQGTTMSLLIMQGPVRNRDHRILRKTQFLR